MQYIGIHEKNETLLLYNFYFFDFGLRLIFTEFPADTYGNPFTTLGTPNGKKNVVIDTDTYNEVDDQFAVVYALHSPE